MIPSAALAREIYDAVGYLSSGVESNCGLHKSILIIADSRYEMHVERARAQRENSFAMTLSGLSSGGFRFLFAIAPIARRPQSHVSHSRPFITLPRRFFNELWHR